MAEKTDLFKLLGDLAADPAKLKEFYDNPDKLLSEYKNLTDEQKKMLASGREYEYIKTVMDESLKQFSSGSEPMCV